eukprot:TRINITY_DN10440_c1_g1_i6.p3 TRINITY_DN10440_c1_g1~~TRINITY_DN10440_c1_g1_i6.p3  ORF type:complete len:123 (-),score=1.53 TRINITY_DN10440_c1_g1_i6:608-976(-)
MRGYILDLKNLLMDKIVVPLLFQSCLEMDVIYPYSISALSTEVKNCIVGFIDEGKTAIRLSSTCKEWRNLIYNNEELWERLHHTISATSNVANFGSFRESYLRYRNQHRTSTPISWNRIFVQ